MGSYDPRACGALCDRCPLSGQRVVPPEVGYAVTPDKIRAREAICIVGEAPGEQEERTGRPFVGRSGEELDKALHRAGFPRQHALVTNVLLCRPPKNELGELLAKIKRENNERMDAYKTALKEATKAGQPLPSVPTLIESPIDCCAPRLEREIASFENFLTLGKTATYAITRNKASIQAVRGSLTELEATPLTPHRKVLPTVHPAFCLRYPRWFHVFHADVEKAGKWFRNEISWKPPAISWQPTPEQLAHFIDARKGQVLSCDIETDGIESLTANVRCVGIGTADEVLVVSLLSKDGRTRFYSPRDEERIIAIFKRWLADPDAKKTGHNFGGYDKVVLRERWGAEVNGLIDTILLHRVVESELPHSLAYVVSMFTIAPAWKTSREGEKLSTDAESDEDLALYCGFDVALTARVFFPLIEGMQARDQVDVFIGDSKIQAVCADMHTVGMYVDQAERQKIEVEALHRRKRILADIRSFLGRPDFNPGSIYQLRDLLFEEWKLVPPLEDEERFTASDDPSTSDLVLRALLTDPGLADNHRHLISLVRRYRKLQKVLGTYIVKLRPANVSVEGDLGWDEEDWIGDGWAEVEMRKRYGLEKKGIVNPYTGRMYPGYNASVAVTGRLSSSKPINAQNVPSALRVMVTAAPGHVLVGADMDQLELRIAAARWGVKLYLRAFEEEKDPHSMTAFAVFGEAFCKAAGIDPVIFSRPGKLIGPAYDEGGKFKLKDGDAYRMRTLSKMVQYACVEENEKVAVLGPEGAKPIREMQIGDWTWAWSRQRHRYEPTRVTEVMPRGTKPCVRVHFAWGRGDRWHGSVVVTTDHLCIMRDGTEREAGSLRPGDRLMPFRRSTIGRYRRVFPFNTGASAGEHRAVAGIYEPGDGRDVHHVNRNTFDNRPENLEPLAPLPHFEEHAEDLAAGRRRSMLWRASVSDSATRSRASLKSWQGRKTRRATDKAYALRSFLEDWREVIGVLPDAEVAERAGCTPPAVAYFRKTRGIAPPVGQRGWLQHLFDTQDAWTDRLCGDLVALSKDIREVFGVHVELTTLRRERRRCITEYRDSLGHVPDGVLADRLGTSTADVAKEREAHGIPLYYEDEPGGTNHRVTRLEFVGDRPVWDIEVDHEDHNFALESGIFVHNSQYKAAVETVAMLIRKTEVAARDADGNELKDGTTELPFALMALRRVREMHQNWLRGAPEFKTGWDREINHFKRFGFVQEYVTGRKRYFLDTAQSRDEKMSGTNEIVNFPIQCVPGHVRVLTEFGYVPIREVEGKTFRAWTGKRWASATCIRKGTADIWRVRTKANRELDCDVSHSFRRRDGSWVATRDLKPGEEVEVDCGRREFGRPRLDANGESVGSYDVPIPTDGSVPDEIWRADFGDRESYAARLYTEVGVPSPAQHVFMETVWPTEQWVKVKSVLPRGRAEPVYTLCVDDEDHSYVANGFISKNSSAAGLMNKALILLHEQIPLNKWGPGTGIINQCHDSIVIECPADGCEEVAVTDPKTGKVKKQMVVRPGSIPEKVARLLEECMNQTDPSLPGVKITATAVVGRTWKDV